MAPDMAFDRSEEGDDLTMVLEQASRPIRQYATPQRLKAMLDRPGVADDEFWDKIVELGWTMTPFSEDAGGLGLGWRGLCGIAQLLGAAAASLPLTATAVAARAVSSMDGELATDLICGKKRAALVLPGPAIFAPVRVEGGRLRGVLPASAFAAFADFALVALSEHAGAGLWGVPLTQNAVQREIVDTIDNTRGVARLTLDDAIAFRIGGDEAVDDALAATVVATCFEQIGGSEACLAMACDYARERIAFGRPIGSFQSIKHALADLYTTIEIARGCANEALSMLEDHGASHAPEVIAAARLASIAAYEFAARQTIQTFGGIGVTWEAQPHHHFRRERALALELGGVLAWRERLVSRLA